MPLSRADFSQLVDQHGEALYRVAYRLVGNAHEAEDIVQESYRSAWTSRDRFAVWPGREERESDEPDADDAAEVEFGGEEIAGRDETTRLDDTTRSQRAWLLSILRRRVADRWRRHKHELSNMSTPELGEESPDPIETGTIGSGFTDEMQRALNRLPQELRESLLLVVVGELTHQETADMLEVPIGTVLSRVSRARARLREQLVAMARSSGK